MNYSVFGEKFTRNTGISQLMDDLGQANHSGDPDMIMLGGGNPALIPEAHDIFVDELQKLIASSDVDQMLGLYDSPQGNGAFIKVLVKRLNEHFDWSLSESNIAITNGSQSSFFYLFNLFAGRHARWQSKENFVAASTLNILVMLIKVLPKRCLFRLNQIFKCLRISNLSIKLIFKN